MLRLAFRGTRFAGWQVQNTPGGQVQRTVQGVLQDALAKICSSPVVVRGSSRTDAGVHALGMVAHADVPEAKARIDFQMALNAHLPKDVNTLSVGLAPPNFHACYSATSKVYAYSLWLSRRYVLPQRRPYVWRVGTLDLQAMDAAIAELVGERDFESFRNQGTPVSSTIRRLKRIEISPYPATAALDRNSEEVFATPGNDPRVLGPELVLTFEADGFLKQMVRNLVGTIVAAGKSKLEPQDLARILAARDRTLAPRTAPAKGLSLVRVHYP